MARIEKLDIPTRVKLRSSQILTSLPQIVTELVQNSIDAGATNIDVGVDCEEWVCWVRDDGAGISRDSLAILASGNEEGRYASSKDYQCDALNTSSTFGFRGEALASAAALGCLEISSRTINSCNTWSIIAKSGKCLYSGPAVRWRRDTSGTVVCIRDAFYNLPVRRLSHPPPTRTMEQIRQELQLFALVLTNISFSLEDVHSESTSKSRIFRIPRASSSLAAFRHIYGRALVEHVEIVSSKSGDLLLEGFISLNGASSKGHQCFYVNRHPIPRCDLQVFIDSIFNASTFGKNALDELGETDLPRSNIRRSPRKTEKQAVYVLNLTVPPNQLDNCLEPTKTDIQFQRRDVVLNLLSTTVTGFLSKNGFLTPHHDQINPPFSSPRKKRKILNDSGFAAGSDYGKPSALEDDDITTHQSTYSRPFIYDLDQSLQQIAWTDPSIGETFIIDTRTGNSCPKDQDGTAASSTRRTIRFPATFVASRDAGHEQPPEWLQKALQSNNTYGIGENSVQKVLTRPPEEQQSDKPMRNQQSSFCDGSISETRQHRFRKEDLSHSVIVEQVDSKFIACLFPSEEGHVLVLVDQHAADERIRVEQFLEDICSGFLRSKNGKDGVHIRQLCPPLPILLTSQEARLLNESSEIQEAFRHWGFHFECSKQEQDIEDQQRDNSASNYAQVFVRGVPEVVSDKLLLGDELRDVVKGFLSQHDANFSMATSCIEDQPNDEVPWLKGLRWCPRGLLDLVNSKACRGAIMFNDSLRISQCEELIHRLSETTFPFQCAHGRPSMVPLIHLERPSSRNKHPLKWSRLNTG